MADGSPENDPGSHEGNSPSNRTFSAFLESSPPAGSGLQAITGLWKNEHRLGGTSYAVLQTPDLRLFCAEPDCDGIRTFRFKGGSLHFGSETRLDTFLIYRCSNCAKSSKRYALHCARDEPAPTGRAYKLGELPQFGVPTPPKLLRLLGEDREVFLKGRRCEFQGLGIGAFSYYRRVVENQKNAILDEVAKVARTVGAPQEVIASIQAAREEVQFRKALQSVSVPQSLLINGHNPLQMLHSALSEGLHGHTDEECLELAQHARAVLADLAERMSAALKDEAELSDAVKKLMARKQRVGPAP